MCAYIYAPLPTYLCMCAYLCTYVVYVPLCDDMCAGMCILRWHCVPMCAYTCVYVPIYARICAYVCTYVGICASMRRYVCLYVYI